MTVLQLLKQIWWHCLKKCCDLVILREQIKKKKVTIHTGFLDHGTTYLFKHKLLAKLLAYLIIVILRAWRINQQMFIEFYSLPLCTLFGFSVFCTYSSFYSVFLRALLNAMCVPQPFLSALLQLLIY